MRQQGDSPQASSGWPGVHVTGRFGGVRAVGGLDGGRRGRVDSVERRCILELL